MPDTQNPVSPTNSAEGEWITIYHSDEDGHHDEIIIDDFHVDADICASLSSPMGHSPVSPISAETEVLPVAAAAADDEMIHANNSDVRDRDVRRGGDIPASSSVLCDDDLPRGIQTPNIPVLPAHGEHEHVSSKYTEETTLRMYIPTAIDVDGNRYMDRYIDGHEQQLKQKQKHEHKHEYPCHRQHEMNSGIYAETPPAGPSTRAVKVLTSGLGTVPPPFPAARPFSQAAPSSSTSTSNPQSNPQFNPPQSLHQGTIQALPAPKSALAALGEQSDQAALADLSTNRHPSTLIHG